MRNIKLTIEYDGTDYSGWQFQKNALSVQEAIEKALLKVCCHKVSLKGASRTDSGVHALGQVANFITSSDAPMSAFKDGLNSILNKDIRILDASEVEEGFDSIKSSLKKDYRYCILNSDNNSAILRNFSWYIRRDLDVALMEQASMHLIGKHDFKSFQGADTEAKTSVREIYSIRFSNGPMNTLLIDFSGDGFLKYMVRNIVGTLAYVGEKRFSLQQLKEILIAKNRTEAGPTAPACGLFLLKVYY